MNTQALEQSNSSHSQHIAWGVMLIAFAAFCMVCILSGMGVHYFLFNSTIPVQSLLRVGRGTIGITGTDLLEQVVRDSRYLLNSNIVSTDRQSQATLFFQDNRIEEQLVAAVTLKSNTNMTLEEASRPRFDWSDQEYRIDLGEVSGELEVLIPDGLDRNVWMTIEVQGGDNVYLTSSGQYVIEAFGGQIDVTNYTGEALLIPDDRSVHAVPVPVGERGNLNIGSNEIRLHEGYVNLLGNSTFQEVNVADLDSAGLETRPLPNSWGCANPPHDPPRGTYGIAMRDGRPTLHLFRGENAVTHGETRCLQVFGPGSLGIDVSMYDYLSLRVTFYIVGHSLSVCGVAGSECPLMLQMQYIPQGAVLDPSIRPPIDFGSMINPQDESPTRSWYHGFFTFQEAQVNYPQRCTSCSEEHSYINDNAWYTYESGNLFQLLPPNQLPQYILNVSLYASGHQYDVYVSEVALLVGRENSGTGDTTEVAGG